MNAVLITVGIYSTGVTSTGVLQTVNPTLSNAGTISGKCMMSSRNC